MPRVRNPELLLDRALVRAPALPVAAGLAVAALLTLTDGARTGAAVAWGCLAVGLTASGAAAVSASGAGTPKGIGVGRVAAMVPVRLAVVGALLAVAVKLLGLPPRPLALATCAAEIAVLARWSALVLRLPTFVGPIDAVQEGTGR